MPVSFSSVGLSSTERDVIRQLFFQGPTWDGDIISKQGRDALCRRSLVHHEFGYAWLTRDGVEIAIHAMQFDRAKEKWENDRRARRMASISVRARCSSWAEVLIGLSAGPAKC